MDAEKQFNMMQWAQLFTKACYQYGFDDDDPIILANDWIVASEDNINHFSQVCLHETGALPHQRKTPQEVSKNNNSQMKRTTTSVDPVPQFPVDHPPVIDSPIIKSSHTVPPLEEPTISLQQRPAQPAHARLQVWHVNQVEICAPLFDGVMMSPKELDTMPL